MSDATAAPAPKRNREDDDPDAFMQKQKERLMKQREEVEAKRNAIDEELAVIDGKLDRIANYFSPPKATVEPKARKPRTSSGSRAPRQSGVRDKVLDEIKKHADGIKAADLIAAMGGKDNKTVETSIRNAVNALKKGNQITSDGGVYKAL